MPTISYNSANHRVDLIPKDNAQAWLKYLRHTTPTLPFRSVSNAQRTNLSSTTSPALMRLLKAYKPSNAQSVTVGVVGYPNVGKSSLINSLKRSKVYNLLYPTLEGVCLRYCSSRSVLWPLKQVTPRSCKQYS